MNQKIELTRIMLPDVTDKIRDDWEHLARTSGANPSLYPAWSEITAESHNISADTDLIAAHLEGETVAVYPVTVSSRHIFGLLWQSLGLLSNHVSYHNNLVSRLAPNDAIKLIVDEAARRKVDVIHLAGIPDDTDLGRYLLEDAAGNPFITHTIRGESSPYLKLEKTWDDLIAVKPKKFRYKLRKRAESINSSEKLELRWFRNSEDCSALLAAIKTIEQNSWKKKAGISIFEREHESQYHRLLLPFLASKQAMFANVLYYEESPIAYNLCCVWGGWVGQLKTSFDERFSEFSPGSVVIDFAIQHAIELDANEFDFLGSADPHKLAWSKSVRLHSDHFLYLHASVKARFLGFLKRIRARYFR